MLASGVIAGVVLGLLIRRTWRPLWALEIRWWPLLIGGLAVRAVAPLVPPAAFPLYVFALAATAGGAARNPRLVGAVLVAIGSSLNLIVVVLNHGMPVDPVAVIAAGATMPSDPLHVVQTGATVLKPLGDVIPVAVFRAAYSFGDLCIAVGAFLVPFVTLTRR